jgi:hypothetical protein
MVKCGECGIDFKTKRALVIHMMSVHGNEFTEESGCPELMKIQEELKKDKDFSAKLEAAQSLAGVR